MIGLFVSKEHKRQARLRINRAYHCIVYVLLAVLLLQIPFCLMIFRERRTASAYALRKAAALEEKGRLDLAAAPLKELAQKVQEARSWSQFAARRMSFAEVLSRLEYSVTDDVCLTEITLRNRAAGPRDPDQIEVEVQGFSRVRGAQEWQLAVEKQFEGWSSSVPRLWRAAPAPVEGGIAPFSLVLKQMPKGGN